MTTYEASVHIAARLAVVVLENWSRSQNGVGQVALERQLQAVPSHAYAMARKLADLAVADDQQKAAAHG